MLVFSHGVLCRIGVPRALRRRAWTPRNGVDPLRADGRSSGAAAGTCWWCGPGGGAELAREALGLPQAPPTRGVDATRRGDAVAEALAARFADARPRRCPAELMADNWVALGVAGPAPGRLTRPPSACGS